MKILFTVFAALGAAHPALAETYSERNAQDRRQAYEQEIQYETQRALAKNARMTAAASAVASFNRSQVRQETLHCPVRTEILRYNPFGSLRPYDDVEYQYCEFNTSQDDACYVAQPWDDKHPVRVWCSDPAHVKRRYDVRDDGRVTLAKKPDAE